MSLLVRPAVPADLDYIDDLQWKNAKMLAFLPLSTFETELHQVIVAEVNGELAGYVYRGAYKGVLKIHQACIQYDLRSQLYGAAMMRQIIDRATLYGVMAVTLRCAADIEANAFWEAMGFVCEGQRPGGISRGRVLNCWRLDLAAPLFATPSMQPVRQKIDRSGYVAPGPETLRASKFSRGIASALLRRQRTLVGSA